MTIHYFFEQTPDKGTKFKATFSDESGSTIFYRDKDGAFYWGDDRDEFISDPEWFTLAGYLYWEYVDV